MFLIPCTTPKSNFGRIARFDLIIKGKRKFASVSLSLCGFRSLYARLFSLHELLRSKSIRRGDGRRNRRRRGTELEPLIQNFIHSTRFDIESTPNWNQNNISPKTLTHSRYADSRYADVMHADLHACKKCMNACEDACKNAKNYDMNACMNLNELMNEHR